MGPVNSRETVCRATPPPSGDGFVGCHVAFVEGRSGLTAQLRLPLNRYPSTSKHMSNRFPQMAGITLSMLGPNCHYTLYRRGDATLAAHISNFDPNRFTDRESNCNAALCVDASTGLRTRKGTQNSAVLTFGGWRRFHKRDFD